MRSPTSWVLLGIFLTLSYGVKSATPELYQFYPNCDYEVVDEVEVRGIIRQDKGQSPEESLAQTRVQLVESLLKMAKEQSADGVIITHKKILQQETGKYGSRINSSRVVLSAELVNQCEPYAPLSNRATPYDENALLKSQIDMGSSQIIERTYVMDVAAVNRRRQPDIVDNTVSFEGAFGVNLEQSFDQVTEVLGTPTLVLEIDPQTQLVSFGRDLWLTFVANKLLKISNQTQWLSNETISLLAFDNRFETQPWKVMGKASFKEPEASLRQQFELSESSNTELTMKQADRTLTLYLRADIIEQSKEPKYRLSGFSVQSDKLTTSPVNIAVNQDSQQRLTSFVLEEDRQALNVEVLKKQALGVAWIDRATRRLIMDNHTIIELQSNAPYKVYLLNRAFNPDMIKQSGPWQVAQFSQGEFYSEVADKLPDTVFSFGDLIEYEEPHFMQQFFFSGQGEELQLTASEIAIF